MSDTITFLFPKHVSTLRAERYDAIRDLEQCDRCGEFNEYRQARCADCGWPRFLQRACWGRNADLVYVPKELREQQQRSIQTKPA